MGAVPGFPAANWRAAGVHGEGAGEPPSAKRTIRPVGTPKLSAGEFHLPAGQISLDVSQISRSAPRRNISLRVSGRGAGSPQRRRGTRRTILPEGTPVFTQKPAETRSFPRLSRYYSVCSCFSELIREEGIRCSCGKVHRCQLRDFRCGPGVVAQLPDVLKGRGRKKPMVVMDWNTRKAGGERVMQILDAAGIPIRTSCFPMPARARWSRMSTPSGRSPWPWTLPAT